MKKYEILKNNSIEFNGKTLYRIKALKNFGNIKKGDIGGFIEKEENLSHENNCWIYGDAEVFGNAKVFKDILEKKINKDEYELFQEQLDVLISQVVNRVLSGHGHPGDIKERANILLRSINIEVE